MDALVNFVLLNLRCKRLVYLSFLDTSLDSRVKIHILMEKIGPLSDKGVTFWRISVLQWLLTYVAWLRIHNLSPWFSKFHRKIGPQTIFCQFISNLQQQSSKSAIILYCVYMILFAAVSLMRVIKKIEKKGYMYCKFENWLKFSTASNMHWILGCANKDLGLFS